MRILAGLFTLAFGVVSLAATALGPAVGHATNAALRQVPPSNITASETADLPTVIGAPGPMALRAAMGATVPVPAAGDAVADSPTPSPRSGDAAKDGGSGRALPAVPDGALLATLSFFRVGHSIEALGEVAVVEGVGAQQLRAGAGRYPHSTRHPEAGNVAIAGHRTTYGAPFRSLDVLAVGDQIVLTSVDGEVWRYDVTGSAVVAPDAVWVVDHDPQATGLPTLTLTTCHPRGSAEQRLIVWATLADAADGHGRP